jgi:hypothetical protein
MPPHLTGLGTDTLEAVDGAIELADHAGSGAAIEIRRGAVTGIALTRVEECGAARIGQRRVLQLRAIRRRVSTGV